MKMDFSKDVDLVALLKVDCQLTEDEEEDLAEMGHGNMFKILKIMLYQNSMIEHRLKYVQETFEREIDQRLNNIAIKTAGTLKSIQQNQESIQYQY